MLRTLLTKHDYDCRYQEPEARSHVASMYLPLLPALWFNFKHVAALSHLDAKRDLLACFLYVLHNVPSSTLSTYITETLKDKGCKC